MVGEGGTGPGGSAGSYGSTRRVGGGGRYGGINRGSSSELNHGINEYIIIIEVHSLVSL